MYKIIGKEKDISVPNSQPNFMDKTVFVIIPLSMWSAEALDICMDAKRLDFYQDERENDGPTASFNLVNWLSCEKLWDGIKVSWNTYAKDRLDDMQCKLDEMTAKLEDTQNALSASQERVRTLTKAILDLAAEYGAIPATPELETSFEVIEGTATSGAADADPLSSVTLGGGTNTFLTDNFGRVVTDDEKPQRRKKKNTAKEAETDG